MPGVDIEVRKRLFEQTKVGGPDDCWVWMGTMDGESYARITIDGQPVKAHRVMYNIYKGEIDGKNVLHKCDIRNCVNPHHLYLGGQSENIQGMWDRGRRKKEDYRGEKVPSSKLTDGEAKEIKERIEAGDETYAEIAEDYPVTESTVGSIAAGELWGWLDDD